MKRMLINATHSEEIRVALADGQKLYNLDIDVPGEDRKKGNIYKGKITRVEPSLEAAFVDYGANRHGFLPYKEISRNYYTDAANKAKERPPINVAIKEGTEVIIQVTKEERGNKGAAITTYVSLAGRYLVYMPENPKAGGISRRIEGKARQQLKAVLSNVNQPKNSGIIVRTAGIGRSAEELDWDLNYLDQVWTAIKTNATNRKAPFFIYQESHIFIRAIRDYLRPDIGEILIDNKEIYEKVRDFMQQVMPHNLKKLSYYNDNIPLFSRYQIERQIQSAFSREVHLPSGGSIVIDHTEAMISIDINSARATKGADIEETALNTNLEAADEIARQLRIRDLGGLVVIDFIDMRNHKNQRSVEQQLNEAVSNDKARIQTTKISKFGLLEMSRQRLKSSINEASQFPCPRCSGHGFIRNIESLSVSILRILEEEVLKPGTGKVIAQVPTKVANFIINDKREELNGLEKRHSVPMLIIANEHYQSPQFDITRLKKNEADNVDINDIELNKPASEEEAENKSSQMSHQHRQRAAVDVLVPDSQVPSREKQSNGGVASWFKSLFSSTASQKSQPTKVDTSAKKKPQHQHKKKPQQGQKKPQQQKKKPQHNKQNNQQQQNKQSQAKGQQNKGQQEKRQQNKPQHNKGKNQNRPQNQANNKTPVNKQDNAKPATKNQKAIETKPDEQLLQRPLGSVASYAANKKANNSIDSQKDQPNKQSTKQAKDKAELKTAKPVASKTEVKIESKQNTPVKNESQKEQIKDKPKTAKQPISSSDTKVDTTKKLEKQADKKPESVTVVQTKTSGTKVNSQDAKENNTEVKPVDKKPKTEKLANKKAEPKKETVQQENKTKETKKPENKPKKATAKVVKPIKVEEKTRDVKKESKPEKQEKIPAKTKANSVKVKKETLVKAEKIDLKKETKEQPKRVSQTKETEVKAVPKPKSEAKPKKKIPDPTGHIDFDI